MEETITFDKQHGTHAPNKPVAADYEYKIHAHDGTHVATKHRREFTDGSKTFWYSRPDGVIGLNGQSKIPLPLYRSEVIDNEELIVIAEGEKAADALASSGYASLGTAGAGQTPAVEVLDFLRGKQVALWPDNDDVGKQHMRKVAERLHTLGVEVFMVNVSDLPEKADAADVDPAVIASYINGAEEYEVPTHEKVTSAPHIYNANDLRKMFSRDSANKWEAQQSGRRLQLYWGFERLDAATGGIKQGLIALHGQPGAGKTAFVSQIAQQVDAPCLFVTAEMSVAAMLKRMVARYTRTPMHQLLSATLSPDEEVGLLETTLAAHPKLRFVDASSDAVTISHMREALTDLKKQDDGGHALLIIDSLHTWINMFLVQAPGSTEYEAINEGVNSLRKLANDLRIPVLIVAERNRASIKDGGLSAIAGSRVAEYRSDMVISLDKADDQSDPHGHLKDINLTVLKNREGSGDVTVPFLFEGAQMRFVEV